MIKLLVKMLALLMVVIVLAVPVGALSVGDETLSGILKGLPVIGDYTEDIIGTKQAIKKTLGEYADDTLYGFNSLYFDVLGFSAPWKTSREVIDLPPLPRTIDQSAPAAAPPAPPPETANKRQFDPTQILPDRQPYIPYLHNSKILGDSHTYPAPHPYK